MRLFLRCVLVVGFIGFSGFSYAMNPKKIFCLVCAVVVAATNAEGDVSAEDAMASLKHKMELALEKTQNESLAGSDELEEGNSNALQLVLKDKIDQKIFLNNSLEENTEFKDAADSESSTLQLAIKSAFSCPSKTTSSSRSSYFFLYCYSGKLYSCQCSPLWEKDSFGKTHSCSASFYWVYDCGENGCTDSNSFWERSDTCRPNSGVCSSQALTFPIGRLALTAQDSQALVLFSDRATGGGATCPPATTFKDIALQTQNTQPIARNSIVGAYSVYAKLATLFPEVARRYPGYFDLVATAILNLMCSTGVKHCVKDAYGQGVVSNQECVAACDQIYSNLQIVANACAEDRQDQIDDAAQNNSRRNGSAIIVCPQPGQLVTCRSHGGILLSNPCNLPVSSAASDEEQRLALYVLIPLALVLVLF